MGLKIIEPHSIECMKTINTKRRSIIWKCSTTEFQKIVNESCSVSEVLIKIGLNNKGSNFRTLRQRITKDNIDLNQLIQNRNSPENIKRRSSKKISLDKILIENSTYSRYNLKKRLIKEKLIENKCCECGLFQIWNEKPISLQLDHINGIYNDNRLCNLRFLCPNCHSQTETFAGRKNKNGTFKFAFVKLIKPPKKFFDKHAPQFSRRKAERPTKEELFKLLWDQPTIKIAKSYGVSDVAINKWAKSYKIEKPPRGYWTKLKFNKL